MTERDPRKLENEDILLRVKDGRYFAWCDKYGAHAEGDGLQETIDMLATRAGEFARFSDASGLTALSPAGRSRRSGSRSWVRPVVILVVSGLIAVQLGYAISTGISRGLRSAFSSRGGGNPTALIETGLLKLADPKNDIAPEQLARILKALRVIKKRYKPIWDEIMDRKMPHQAPKPSDAQ